MMEDDKQDTTILVDHRGYTIDDALDAIGFGRLQWFLLILSGVGFFATTVEIILGTLIGPSLGREWPESVHGLGKVYSVLFAGELVGGFLWGNLSDLIGRRVSFLGTATLATLFAVLCALSPSYNMLLFSRFGLGLAIGGSLSIDFVYFVEFVPARSRGIRTTWIIFFGICAFFYTALIGHTVLPVGWRWFVIAAGAPYALLLVGRFCWKWESPRFLLSHGRIAQAEAVLRVMAAANGKHLPPGGLVSLEPAPAQQQRNLLSTYKDLWASGLTLSVVTMGLLFFGQTFGYYGLTTWLHRIIAAKRFTDMSPKFLFLLIGVSETAGLVLYKLLIDTKGRRLVMIVSFVGSALSCCCMQFVEARTPFLALFCLTYFFIIGGWTGLYIITPELFPTNVRSVSFAIAQCCGKVAGFLSPMIFQYLWDGQFQPVWILLTIAGSFGLAAVTAGLLLMETAGRRLKDTV